MTDNPRRRRAPGPKRRTVRGGRAVKLAARGRGIVDEFTAWIDRKIPYFEVLDSEALELIEHNADTVLEEIGIEFAISRGRSNSSRMRAQTWTASACGSRAACAGRSSGPRRRASTCNTRVTRGAVRSLEATAR